MKRSITWLTVAILIAACAISCGKDGTESRISVKPEKLDFGSGGGTQKFAVTAENTTWTVSSSGQWIGYEINPENSKEVIVTVEATDYSRAGYVYITSKDAGTVSVQISQKGASPSLSADKSELRFSLEGGSNTLTVRAVNVIWSVFPSNDWIGWEFGEGPDDIVITVSASATSRTGSVKLIGDGVDEVVIKIVQQESGFVFKKPSRDIMNLSGQVKTVSYHEYYPRDAYATNLVFDETGWLQSYVYTKLSQSTVDVSIAYDGANRISKITVVSQANNYDYDIVFEYGAHGKYITTDEMIITLSTWDMYGTQKHNIAYYLWMPQLIEDLIKVSVVDRTAPAESFYIRYDVNGDACTGYIKEEGSGEEPYFEFEFKGNFVGKVTYGSGFWATDCSYAINTETGCVLKNTQFGGDVILTFLNNRINCLSKVESQMDTNYDYNYNGNLDMSGYSRDGTYQGDINYEYDSAGNWINMTKPTEAPVERTITYW